MFSNLLLLRSSWQVVLVGRIRQHLCRMKAMCLSLHFVYDCGVLFPRDTLFLGEGDSNRQSKSQQHISGERRGLRARLWQLPFRPSASTTKPLAWPTPSSTTQPSASSTSQTNRMPKTGLRLAEDSKSQDIRDHRGSRRHKDTCSQNEASEFWRLSTGKF